MNGNLRVVEPDPDQQIYVAKEELKDSFWGVVLYVPAMLGIIGIFLLLAPFFLYENLWFRLARRKIKGLWPFRR